LPLLLARRWRPNSGIQAHAAAPAPEGERRSGPIIVAAAAARTTTTNAHPPRYESFDFRRERGIFAIFSFVL